MNSGSFNLAGSKFFAARILSFPSVRMTGTVVLFSIIEKGKSRF
jgi:hypothetical protein